MKEIFPLIILKIAKITTNLIEGDCKHVETTMNALFKSELTAS